MSCIKPFSTSDEHRAAPPSAAKLNRNRAAGWQRKSSCLREQSKAQSTYFCRAKQFVSSLLRQLRQQSQLLATCCPSSESCISARACRNRSQWQPGLALKHSRISSHESASRSSWLASALTRFTQNRSKLPMPCSHANSRSQSYCTSSLRAQQDSRSTRFRAVPKSSACSTSSIASRLRPPASCSLLSASIPLALRKRMAAQSETSSLPCAAMQAWSSSMSGDNCTEQYLGRLERTIDLRCSFWSSPWSSLRLIWRWREMASGLKFIIESESEGGLVRELGQRLGVEQGVEAQDAGQRGLGAEVLSQQLLLNHPEAHPLQQGRVELLPALDLQPLPDPAAQLERAGQFGRLLLEQDEVPAAALLQPVHVQEQPHRGVPGQGQQQRAPGLKVHHEGVAGRSPQRRHLVAHQVGLLLLEAVVAVRRPLVLHLLQELRHHPLLQLCALPCQPQAQRPLHPPQGHLYQSRLCLRHHELHQQFAPRLVREAVRHLNLALVWLYKAGLHRLYLAQSVESQHCHHLLGQGPHLLRHGVSALDEAVELPVATCGFLQLLGQLSRVLGLCHRLGHRPQQGLLLHT